MARRSCDSWRAARVMARVPGAGITSWVRIVRRAFSSLWYLASSAWQTRQELTWCCTASSTGSPTSTARGRIRATSSHRTSNTSPLLEEHVPQALAGPVQADLGRRHRDPELLGDRLMGEVVHVLQDHDGPQLGRELRHGVGEPLVERRRLGAGLGVGEGTVVNDLGALIVERVGPVAAAPLSHRGRGVGRDPVQPRRELRVAAEPAYRLPGAEVGLLHHVARILLVPGQPEGERVRRGVGLADQFLERLLVTVAGGGDQLLLAQRVSPVVSIPVGLPDGGQRYGAIDRPSVMAAARRRQRVSRWRVCCLSQRQYFLMAM